MSEFDDVLNEDEIDMVSLGKICFHGMCHLLSRAHARTHTYTRDRIFASTICHSNLRSELLTLYFVMADSFVNSRYTG